MSESHRKLAADTWGALLQVHAALVPTLDRLVREQAGLPLTWYDVLLELAGATGGKLRMSVLAERVVLSRTRVSRLVDELSGEGLVCREDNPEDAARPTQCSLTPDSGAFGPRPRYTSTRSRPGSQQASARRTSESSSACCLRSKTTSSQHPWCGPGTKPAFHRTGCRSPTGEVCAQSCSPGVIVGERLRPLPVTEGFFEPASLGDAP